MSSIDRRKRPDPNDLADDDVMAVTDQKTRSALYRMSEKIKACLHFYEDQITDLHDSIDPPDLSSLEGGQTSLNDRLTQAEADITALETADVALSGRLDTLEVRYEQGTISLTHNGWASSPFLMSGIPYVKHGRQVTLYLPAVFTTSNSTTATFTGLPSNLLPYGNTYYLLPGAVDAGGTAGAGMISLSHASSTIKFIKNQTFSSAWTASGLKGFNDTVITYYTES